MSLNSSTGRYHAYARGSWSGGGDHVVGEMDKFLLDLRLERSDALMRYESCTGPAHSPTGGPGRVPANGALASLGQGQACRCWLGRGP
ncbi:hypothetical protein GCM10010424_37820 [Streptomyces lienomycini]